MSPVFNHSSIQTTCPKDSLNSSMPSDPHWRKSSKENASPDDVMIVEYNGAQAANFKLCKEIAELQMQKTMSAEQIAKILAQDPNAHKSGMGGAESLLDVIENSHRPGWRALAVYKNEKFLGFQDFTLDPIPMEIFILYRHFKNNFPQHLQNFTRDQIGFGGTVAMNIKGQYQHTHARMVECQRHTGKKLILDFCFTLNEHALSAHQKQGYNVLCNADNQPIQIKWRYKTNDQAGNNLYILYLEADSEYQTQLIEAAKMDSQNGDFSFIDLTNND